MENSVPWHKFSALFILLYLLFISKERLKKKWRESKILQFNAKSSSLRYGSWKEAEMSDWSVVTSLQPSLDSRVTRDSFSLWGLHNWRHMKNELVPSQGSMGYRTQPRPPEETVWAKPNFKRLVRQKINLVFTLSKQRSCERISKNSSVWKLPQLEGEAGKRRSSRQERSAAFRLKREQPLCRTDDTSLLIFKAVLKA